MRMLNADGYNVTQATVSRDIKDLKLIKLSLANGKYRYSTAGNGATREPETRFISLCSQNGISADFAENICVIKCMSGTANAICAAIDVHNYPNIVGTLAGDDTIFVLFKSDIEAEDFASKMNGIIGS